MKCDNLRPQWGAWGRILPALLIALLLAGCGGLAHAFHLVRFEDVARLVGFEFLQGNATFEASLDIAHIFLEALQ